MKELVKKREGRGRSVVGWPSPAGLCLKRAPDSLREKWTCDLPLHWGSSGRHIF